MPEPENELAHILSKLSADMGDLADSTSRLAHKSEDNPAIMNSLAELIRGNTAALTDLAAQVHVNTATARGLLPSCRSARSVAGGSAGAKGVCRGHADPGTECALTLRRTSDQD